MTTLSPLQRLVLPNLETPAPESLYLRPNDRAWVELGVPRVHFEAGGVVHTDTWFGAFPVSSWKRHAALSSLVLEVEGSGDFMLSLGLHTPARHGAWLTEQFVSPRPGKPARLEVPGWAALTTGLLYFRLRALGAAVLDGARWSTPDAPRQEVTLGVVVTHFNRVAQVVPAIERLRRHLFARPELQDRLTLTVVDNSNNLPDLSHLGADDRFTVLPNRNLGGTGGFTRGLLSLLDDGRHTHCLFMDDDASCEPESIARIVTLLQHARTPRLAVAGALLDELRPWQLMEKGARFDGMCRPLHAGLDMGRLDDLLQTETRTERPDYGGWWCFAFALKDIRRFPFPFFVRGDDVFFSLANGFHIATPLGIGCWGEPFWLKHGPMTAYLDARYHLLHALLDDRRGGRGVLRLAKGLFWRPLFGYQYATARAFTLAMEHLLQGPRFFQDHLDLADVRAQIGAWTPVEKLSPLQDVDALPLRGPRRRPESALRRLGRKLTLQGFLLPRALLRDRVLRLGKGYHVDEASVFRFRRVLYEHADSGTGYLLPHDKRLFFGELRRFLRALATLLRRLPALRRAHAAGFDAMTTQAFWRDLYATELAASPAGPAATARDVPPAPQAAPADRATAPTATS
ncbi:glycosyltransferase [Aquabacterium sp. J223]|uniref:glycosyltransferase n=1 Tax=Aquabacterium sp. J223 TaxID=2898431 RepID=UPI0021ADD504|nr:glycosyltransferase [Aquabacterium sp. J223]UUX95062.1 glycosyltransferase [Aquabacterium sp. J223]